METTNLNIDAKTLEMCVKEINNFGGTFYQNICDGTKTYVAWGNADWTLAIIVTILGVALTGAVLVLFFKFMFE